MLLETNSQRQRQTERQTGRQTDKDRQCEKEVIQNKTSDLESVLSLCWRQSFLLDQFPETRVVQVVDVACRGDNQNSKR